MIDLTRQTRDVTAACCHCTRRACILVSIFWLPAVPTSCTLVASIVVSLISVGSRVGNPSWWGWDTGEGWIIIFRHYACKSFQIHSARRFWTKNLLASSASNVPVNSLWQRGIIIKSLKLSNQENLAAHCHYMCTATFYFLKMRSKNRRWTAHSTFHSSVHLHRNSPLDSKSSTASAPSIKIISSGAWSFAFCLALLIFDGFLWTQFSLLLVL